MSQSRPLDLPTDHAVRTPETELAAFQKRSEAKFPPGSPPPRIHELPSRAAPNEAAATPTLTEEPPLSEDDPGWPLAEADVSPPVDPDDPEIEAEAVVAEEAVEDAIAKDRFTDDGAEPAAPLEPEELEETAEEPIDELAADAPEPGQDPSPPLYTPSGRLMSFTNQEAYY